MMMIVIMMIIASYTNENDHHRDDDRIVHKWWWSSSWWWSHRTQIMMIIIILTALYIGDDVCIVYIMHWPYTLSYFSVTEKGTNEQGDSRSRKWPNLIKMSGVCPLCPELGLMQFLIWSYWILLNCNFRQKPECHFSLFGEWPFAFFGGNLFPFLCHHIYLITASDSSAVERQQSFLTNKNAWLYFVTFH